jgi:hypothetical protein
VKFPIKTAIVLLGTGAVIYANRKRIADFMQGVRLAIADEMAAEVSHQMPVPGSAEWEEMARRVADQVRDKFKALVTEAQVRRAEEVSPNDPDYVPDYASGLSTDRTAFTKENADATQQDRSGDWCGTDRIDPDRMRTGGSGHLPPHTSPYVRNAHPGRIGKVYGGASNSGGADDKDVEDFDPTVFIEGNIAADGHTSADQQATD